MTKRILAVILAAAIGLCMFTACGKKDDTQTQQSATQGDADTAKQKEETQETQPEADTKNDASEKEEASEPIEMTTEEFEELVDTFNNPQSDAEKEEARLKLEAVLKQMEQAQQ
jgi:hypothetical protein